MPDLEFYQKALNFQSWLVNRLSEVKAYGSNWGENFYMKEIKNAINKFYSDNSVRELFSLSNLTKDRVEFLRFQRWNDTNPDLYLFPLWFVFFLPYGTRVVSIEGEVFEYTENTDLDTRFGCVAFGIELKQ